MDWIGASMLCCIQTSSYLSFSTLLLQREELFAALDEVTENHMTLKDNLEEARAINHEKMLEKEEAEAECKEVRLLLLLFYIWKFN